MKPAAWIDDDFTPLDHDWAARRTSSGIPTLLIKPDPYAGLQCHHIVAVRLWADPLPMILTAWGTEPPAGYGAFLPRSSRW
ncbi:hypothetical protein [Thermobifida alba]|uniref:hypothetical protein n=1 Tax=Thermobifida alba TaxID=53522 RepID=UPI0020C0E889|nr:hypothetical protein [Thermobifida alba]